MHLAWEGEALRISGFRPTGAERLRVVPAELVDLGDGAALPGTPGTWRTTDDGEAVAFSPRFPFVPGRRYAVLLDGRVAGVLERPAPARPSGTRVVGVYPSGDTVPRNLLRMYVRFSAPMSEGCARGIHFTGLESVFLPTAEELWDPGRTRLTLLLDPARIKRGLTSHEVLGYPLRTGDSVQFVVDGMRDASGDRVGGYTKHFVVGPDLLRRVDPSRWTVTSPAAGTRETLVVTFDRPLDHALLQRTIEAPVPGIGAVGPGEMSWQFTPHEPWQPGRAALVIDGVLEDPAGNSLQRAFDRDLDDRRDDPVYRAEVHLTFHVGPSRDAHA